MNVTAFSNGPSQTSPRGNGGEDGLDEMLLEHVPRSADRILHVGCGDGSLAAKLKACSPARVFGIEGNEARARQAEGIVDDLIIADAQQVEETFEPASFDCIVCGVLDRLRDPASLLSKVRRWLREDGLLLAHVGNARHHSTVLALLQGGRLRGDGAGLNGRRAMRWYTRREVEKLLYRAGLDVARSIGLPGEGYQAWREQGRPGEVKLGTLLISGLSTQEAEDFYARGHVFLARPAKVAGPGFELTSIVIVTHNQISYTRQCLESIRFRTDDPYELIVVDNGSTDGTVDYLRSVGDVRLIENSENRGFPAAANQGIEVAAGEQILLLNNDTLAVTGWLRRQLEALYSDPEIGLVGPCSNNVSGPQQVAVTYRDLACLDGFAWEWGKKYAGNWIETDRLVGFCLLIRRGVVDRIGLLDERFGIGNFEDDDFCLRAARAGYRLLNARDAFVHHFGSVTFRSAGVDFAGLLKENELKFRSKWAAKEREEKTEQPAVSRASEHAGNGKPRFALELDDDGEGGLLLAPAKIILSLCMIVRDNQHTIRPCLESIRPWVDEMIVVDTGSTDKTPDIARELGARIYCFPWIDDFSAARNESLKYARGEWIFWMDSDDTISEENGRKLRDLVRQPADPSLLGYVMQVHCPGPESNGDADVTFVDHVKVFRNLPHLRFEGRIHEQILAPIRAAGGEVGWSDLFVVHSGADHTPEGRQGKLKRDLHLLELDLAERPDHPFVLFNLGMTYADTQDYEAAINALKQCLEVSASQESHVRKAYALLVSSYFQLARHDEAWEASRQGRSHYPDDAELLFREGMLHHEFGRLTEAANSYQRAASNDEARHFTSIDPGIAGFKARHNLAVVYADLGRLDLAEAQWREIVRTEPSYRQGWRGLGENLLQQKKLVELTAEAERLLDQPRLRSEGFLLQAKVAEAEGDVPKVREALNEAMRSAASDDLEPLRAWCQFLFMHGEVNQAAEALSELTLRAPDDASGFYNLGMALLRLGRQEDAVGRLEESLRLRPQSAPTNLHLGYALQQLGRKTEAEAAWRRALEIDPENDEARTALNAATP